MRINKGLLLLTSLAFVMLASTAYASSSNFLTQAQKYIKQNCSNKNLTNQTALLCYLFNKSQEQDASIASLSATLSPIPGQITNLQNTAAGKSLHVFDANNQELGILESLDLGQITVYSTTSGELIHINSINGVPNIGFQPEEFYTSADCSGTAYISNSDIADKLLFNVRGTYMQVNNSASPQTLTIHSQSNSQTCEFNDNFQESNLRPLTPTSNPYQNPVAFPLQYKYQ